MCDGHMERISNLETMCCDGELHKHTDKWLAYMSHYDDTVQMLRKELDRQDDIQHKLYSKIADMEERHVSLIHHNHRDIKTLEEKNSLHKEHVHSDHNHIDTPQSSQTSTDKLQYDNVPLLSQDNSQSTQYYLVQGHDDPLSNFYRCTLKVTIDGIIYNYSSLEQGFQHHKALVLEAHDISRSIMNNTNHSAIKEQANRLDNHVNVTTWESMEMDVMRDLLKLKLHSCNAFRDKLFHTGTATLLHSVVSKKWESESTRPISATP